MQQQFTRGSTPVQHRSIRALDLLAHPAGAALAEGTQVAVRNKFNGVWSKGFVVVETVYGSGGSILGYRIGRVVGGDVLPGTMPVEDVIPLKKRQ